MQWQIISVSFYKLYENGNQQHTCTYTSNGGCPKLSKQSGMPSILHSSKMSLNTVIIQPAIADFNPICIAGRPKAALLLWFFGDFRCGALLFVVSHVL